MANSKLTRPRPVVPALVLTLLAVSPAASGQTVEAPYDTDYTIQSLGLPPGVPLNLGGVSFLDGDVNTLVIGSRANSAAAKYYTISITRDPQGHISGFGNDAAELADAPLLDGGLDHGPGRVLFYTRFPDSEVGQIVPGSTTTDKVVDLKPFGIADSPGGLQFVPGGYPGAGLLKITTYGGSSWYSASVISDGNGTYDLTDVTGPISMGGTMEGIAYVPPASPQMQDYNTVLINEYGRRAIALYSLDANGDPLPGTRSELITGISKPEGIGVDPLSGDMIVSTFNGTCFVIQGFGPPCPAASWANYGQGWPGSLGVPECTLSANPVLGSTLDVNLGNSAGVSSFGLLCLGFQSAAIPTNKGGTLLTLPYLIIPLPLPGAGLVAPVTLPTDEFLCGVPLFCQLLVSDPGASHGLAFSQGVTLVFGS